MRDRLHKALAQSARSLHHGALLFIDLDRFKELNDALGHSVGDDFLREVGKRLVQCVREGDSVARFGGDEFVVMLENLDRDMQRAAEQADEIGGKIHLALNQVYAIDAYSHHSSPSIGVALFRGHEAGVDEVIKRADIAMYHAKDSGRNAMRFFDPVLQDALAMRAALAAELRDGLANRQFVLYYQPQIGISNQLIGAEALVRWQHPRRGIVAPGEFISVAEQSGQILELGEAVLCLACAQLAAWQLGSATAGLQLSVNVSALQLRDAGFVSKVRAAIEASGADPAMLKLELTESQLVTDTDGIIVKMNALREYGVRFSMDDFGTGYSSLGYLKRMPLSQLKIDRSFVTDILSDANDAAIAQMVVALGTALGLTIIAEGVETAQQRDFLERLGCHGFQGYLYSRPLPADEFGVFVANWQQ